jgi:hypothetical protein
MENLLKHILVSDEPKFNENLHKDYLLDFLGSLYGKKLAFEKALRIVVYLQDGALLHCLYLLFGRKTNK